MKRLIRPAFFLLMLCSLFFIGCKKDSSGESTYYVKFKMDGNWITWNRALGEVGNDPADPGRTQFSLSAQNAASTELLNIGVTVNSGSLATGTYSTDNSFMALSYMKNTNTQNITSYTGGGFLGGGDTRYEVTITAVTDKVVKGSFTGTFLRNTADDTDVVNITEGEFVLQRVR
ncbi:MAG: hypothetical protein ACTHMD_14910 [Flavisolibacter sp.]